MKVLTPAQMARIDQATIAAGIPGIILMETAAARVVEYIAAKFAPVTEQRIVVVCGKGNNGGDGLAIARQIYVRFRPRFLRVVSIGGPQEPAGDAAENLRMLRACGLREAPGFDSGLSLATLVVDAVLGTGLRGAAQGEALDAIRRINADFPLAKVVAVDIPSGLSGASGCPPGEFVRADATVTFTAPKICHALPPACDCMGELVVAPIGSPAALFEDDPSIDLSLITPDRIAPLFAPRPRDANKGTFGHALIAAGSPGKAGAAAMAGIAALRAGAGLVTIACPESVQPAISGYYPELMTEPIAKIDELAAKRTAVAIGPGIGTEKETAELVCRLFDELEKTLILDADALNCLALRGAWRSPAATRILTPHPGEMSRLTGRSVTEIQADRVAAARAFSTERGVILVLKGERTLIAYPDGRVSINPTGSPAMATGGTGDILTGMIAGLAAQFPAHPERATEAAVYLHGLAGEIAARRFTEQCVIATDLLAALPEGIREIAGPRHPL